MNQKEITKAFEERQLAKLNINDKRYLAVIV